MLYLCIAFSIIVPYLICSINPAIIAAKIKSGKDIREMGSGSAGLTNSLRTQGKGVAAIVLLCDVAKGVISILAVVFFTETFYYAPLIRELNEENMIMGYLTFITGTVGIDPAWFSWIGALTAVIGHCYPIWHKFKGGKAVLVTVATGLVICWPAALIPLVLFIIIVAVSKYVSLGSVIASVAYPICVGLISAFVFKGHSTLIGVLFSSVICILLIFKHRENIKRLIAGTENKLGSKK